MRESLQQQTATADVLKLFLVVMEVAGAEVGWPVFGLPPLGKKLLAGIECNSIKYGVRFRRRRTDQSLSPDRRERAPWRGPVAGGLMSYGGDLRESYRHVGLYAGRILKGTEPTNLPIYRARHKVVSLQCRRSAPPLHTQLALGTGRFPPPVASIWEEEMCLSVNE